MRWGGATAEVRDPSVALPPPNCPGSTLSEQTGKCPAAAAAAAPRRADIAGGGTCRADGRRRQRGTPTP